MKILLTGGLGYIGSHTCVELLQDDYEVVIIDNLSNTTKSVLGKIEKITSKKPIFYQADVRDKTALKNIFDKHKIDGVIHFAGLKAVGESVEKPLKYYDNNISGTISLLEIMQKFKCKTFVFSSSATVYGNPKSLPITENSPLFATNPYGRSKLIIEEILQDLFIADNNLRIGILRYFNPVGAHSSGLIGEKPNGIPNNLMPYIAQVAAGKLPKLKIFGDDYQTSDGTGVRDYIHVVDLAKGHLKALQYLRDKPTVLKVNLGTGCGYSVLEMVKEFEVVSGKKITYDIVSRRSGDVGSCYADITYAKSALRWQAKYKLHEMCVDTWRWQTT
jgi:UDP-glucose 4-epimerase